MALKLFSDEQPENRQPQQYEGLRLFSPHLGGVRSGAGLKYDREQAQQQQQTQQTQQQDSPSLLESVQRFTPGRGLAEGIGNLVGSRTETRTQDRLAESRQRQADQMLRQIRDPDLSDDQRRRLNELLQNLISEGGEQMQRYVEEADTRLGSSAQRSALAGGAELGLFAATGAAGRLAGLDKLKKGVQTGRLARGGATTGTGITRARGADAVARAGRATSVMGTEGGLLGATQGLQDPNMTSESLRRSIGTGLLGGAATGGLFTGGARVAGAVGDARRASRARQAEQLDSAAKQTSNKELGIKGSKIDSGPINKLNDMVRRGVDKVVEPIAATRVGAKTREFIQKAEDNLRRSTGPIIRQLQQAEQAGQLPKGAARRVETLIRDVKTSQTQAEFYMRNNQSWNRVISGQGNRAINKKQLNELNEYLEARIELNLMDNVTPQTASVERRARFSKTVEELGNEDYAERYDALINYNRELTDMLVDAGIVKRETAEMWRRTNSEYINVQRVVDDLSQQRPSTGGGVASIRGTRAELKRKGSTRVMQDAVQTSADRTTSVMREINRNRASTELIDALQSIGVASPARTAENVLTRQGLQEALALSRPLKRQLERFTKTQKKYVRRIQSEINRLQAEARGEVEKGLRQATRGQTFRPTDFGEVPAENINAVIEEILSANKTTLNRLNRKFMNREPKLAKAIEDLQDMQSTLNGVNAQRRLEYEEILKRADEKIKGKPTISRRVDGVDEVYTTLPEIEAAAKGWDRLPMMAWGRALATPVRVLKATLTGGLNPAFVPKSLVRDGVESFNLSRNAMVSHSPQNILGTIAEAAGKDEFFQNYLSTEGATTFIDILRKPRSAAQNIRRQSRLQLPPVARKTQLIKSPGEWYRVVEDTSRWQELLGRYQNYRGAYNDAIKRGMNEADALVEARWAARNNQVDFFETGNWSPVLNSLYPYFNSTIQGGQRIARALREKPVTTSVKLVGSIQIPTVMAAMYNLSDPRRAEIYLDMPDYERENNWVFVLPGSEKTKGRWNVVKIPKPPGVGNFSNPVEAMTVSMYGDDPVEFGDLVRKFINSNAEAFGSPVDISSRKAALGSVTPQIIKPAIQAEFNQDFFTGRKIVPEWMMEDEPEPFKQHYDHTSGTAKAIGKTLDMSPLIVEKLLQDTFGEFGRNALFYIDSSLEGAGVTEGVGGRSNLESLQRVFTTAAGGVEGRQYREQLNSVFDGYQPTSSRITELVQDNKTGDANRLAREHNEKIDELIRTANEREEFVSLTDAQREYLEGRKFPMDGDRLSDRSIQSRLNQ